MDWIISFGGGWSLDISAWDGQLIQTWTIFDAKVPAEYPTNADGTLSFILLPRTLEDGSTVIKFHFFSLDTKTMGERFLTEENIPLLPSIEIRDQAGELPFGVDAYSGPRRLSLIFPKRFQFDNYMESLNIKTSDFDAMTTSSPTASSS